MNAAKIFRRPSEGAAAGCRGNSAAPEPEAKPRRPIVQSRSQQKSFLFLLEEKIGVRKIRKAEKTFLLVGERQRAAAGRSGWFRSGISDIMSSSGVVKTHQISLFELRLQAKNIYYLIIWHLSFVLNNLSSKLTNER